MTLEIYKSTESFPDAEKFGLISQMRRASYSIPSNIAEGCGRESDADFKRFLVISRGSAAELEYFLILSRDLELLNVEQFDLLFDKVNRVKRSLNNLINKI